jgi:DEAD/DEAH box helicase domain-containing protein
LGTAAIGEIRPTDVVIFTLDRVSLEAGIIPTGPDDLPAGLPALWSFAEMLRRGSGVALDLQSEELQVGLKPVRIGGLQTARIFLADRLENGAGYAPELGQPEKVKDILAGILGELALQYEGPDHRDCSDACPDCLKTWDNRQLHWAMDWRLGLDVAALAMGEDLDPVRWFVDIHDRIERFLTAYRAHRSLIWGEISGLPYIATANKSSAIILGHPLWMQSGAHLNDVQQSAGAELESTLGISSIRFSDPFTLQRSHSRIMAWLQG